MALVEAILRLNRVVHAPYYALFLVGPAANVVEIWWTSRHKAVAPAAAASPQSVTKEAVVESAAWCRQDAAVETPLTLLPK